MLAALHSQHTACRMKEQEAPEFPVEILSYLAIISVRRSQSVKTWSARRDTCLASTAF